MDATIPVKPGQTISYVVGCNGPDGHEYLLPNGLFDPLPHYAHGWSFGGGSGYDSRGSRGGTGGGSSAVCSGSPCQGVPDSSRTGSAIAIATFGAPLAVAGGGGGSGVQNCTIAPTGPAPTGGDGGASSAPPPPRSARSGAGPNGADGLGPVEFPGGVGGSNRDTRYGRNGGSSKTVLDPQQQQYESPGGGGGGGYVGGRPGTSAITRFCFGSGGGGGGSSWATGTVSAVQFSTGHGGSVAIHFLTAQFNDIGLINRDRVRIGPGPLVPQAALSGLAQKWADHIAATGRDSHDPTKWAPPCATSWAENIGHGRTLGAVEANFMASTSQRANIVNPNFTAVMTGVVKAKNNYWVVQRFTAGCTAAPTTTTTTTTPALPATTTTSTTSSTTTTTTMPPETTSTTLNT